MEATRGNGGQRRDGNKGLLLVVALIAALFGGIAGIMFGVLPGVGVFVTIMVLGTHAFTGDLPGMVRALRGTRRR